MSGNARAYIFGAAQELTQTQYKKKCRVCRILIFIDLQRKHVANNIKQEIYLMTKTTSKGNF